jgi:folate-binding Fe-S cluster repair protein YgfZ
VHHEHEYNAIQCLRSYRYLAALQVPHHWQRRHQAVNRIITRDINKVKVGQVIYCCWCDEQGKSLTTAR